MTFSIPPWPPPPPRLLHAEGEVLQRIVLYAPSSVLRFVLFFLLIAIRLLLVLAVRFRVVPPGVPLMSLLAKGRLASLGVIRARCSDPCAGAKHCTRNGVSGLLLHTYCVRPLPQCAQVRRWAPATVTWMLRRGCASVQYRWQRRAHCHSHMLSVPRHLFRARQVANALAAAYRSKKPRTACDQDICLPKRRICNAIWLAESTPRATWRYAATRGWISRPVWCRGPRAAYHTFLALCSTHPHQYPAVQKRMQSREEKHGEPNQGAMSSKHVTDKTNKDNEGCMLRAHTCLCFQLENNEAHLARLLQLPLLQRSIRLQPLLTVVGVQRGGHFVRRGPQGQRGRRTERGKRSKRTSRSTGGSTEAEHGKRGRRAAPVQRSERWKQRHRQHAKCFSP